MAWDKTAPATSDDWNVAVPKILTNNTAVETALDQDHDFTTGSTQTGKHSRATLIENAGDETGVAGSGTLWNKSGRPNWRNETGTVEELATDSSTQTLTNKTLTSST